MKTLAAFQIAGLALTLPLATFAQSSDSQYCQVLSHEYTKYVADQDAGKNHVQPSADVATAQSKCASDPASAIPVLQKALSDKKITVPPRT